MPEFITLHSDACPVVINTSMIWRFYRDPGRRMTTLIYTTGTERLVKETPEQILELLQPKMITVIAEPQEVWRSMLPGGEG